MDQGVVEGLAEGEEGGGPPPPRSLGSVCGPAAPLEGGAPRVCSRAVSVPVELPFSSAS